jgi:hypothetical protein
MSKKTLPNKSQEKNHATEHIGSGGARDVYELVGTPWAVKIQKQGQHTWVR